MLPIQCYHQNQNFSHALSLMMRKRLKPCFLAILSCCKCPFMSWEIWQSHTTMPGTAITADGLSDSSSKGIHTVRLVKTHDNPKFGPIFVWIIAKWLLF